MTSPALIVPLPVNRFPNKLAPNVSNNILRNPPFRSFALFLIVSLTPFINNPDCSRDLTIPMISIISSLESINVVVLDPNQGNPVSSNGPKSLPKNRPDYPILYNCVFDNFILAVELFSKALQSFATCLLFNNNLCGKLFSLLESTTTFDEIFKVTSAPFFIPDFNLLSCELDNLTFKVLYWVILCRYYIKTKCNYNTLTIPS